MSKKSKTVVFCDTSNDVIDDDYADKLRESFRKLTGWKVEHGTPIWLALSEFSKGYSRNGRNTTEVAAIFAIANGILSI